MNDKDLLADCWFPMIIRTMRNIGWLITDFLWLWLHDCYWFAYDEYCEQDEHGPDHLRRAHRHVRHRKAPPYNKLNYIIHSFLQTVALQQRITCSCYM